MKEQIQLGDKVKCKYTGFEGTAVAKTEFINGCVQVSIAGKWDKKSAEAPETSIDEQSLIIVKKGERHKQESEDENEGYTGGATRPGFKMKGY